MEKRAQLTRKRQFEDQESRSVDAEGEGLEDKEVEGTEGMKGWNKKKGPGHLVDVRVPENGSCLLFQLVGQYHRR